MGRASLPDFWTKIPDSMPISKVPKAFGMPSVAWVSKLPRLPRVPQALMTPRSPGFHSSLGRIFQEASVQACSLWVCTDTQGPFNFQSTERSIRTFFASLAISTLTNFGNGLVPVP
jgi:hypothetical protein